MNEYILIVIALAPGFIGIATSKLLNGDTSAEPLNNGIMKYFLYSSTSMLMAEYCTDAHPITKALNSNGKFTLDDFVTPMLLAIAIAIAWNFFIKFSLLFLINIFLRLLRYNTVGLPSYQLENLVLDGKAHYLEIVYPNGEKIKGALTEYDPVFKTLTLKPLPNWTEHKDIQYFEKSTTVLLENGTIIKEFDYKNVGSNDKT